MVLDCKDGKLFMAETFDGLIVEVQMRQLAAIRHRIPFYAEAVILGGDLDLPCPQIFYRMIGSAMTEF